MVKLDTATAVPYLLDRGVVTPRDVVQGQISIEDISRRNRNFRVKIKDASGFLVKQSNSNEGDTRDSLLVEAQVLRFIATDDVMESFRPFAPSFVDFDPRNAVLITELIQPATSISKLHLHYGEVLFPLEAAETAGRVLGRYHSAGSIAVAGGRAKFLTPKTPNGFGCISPEYLPSRGTVGLQFKRLTENEAYVKDAPRVLTRFRTFRGLVHGDARWMNFLVGEGLAPDGSWNIRVIDWELAGLGDSAWDVASYLGDYIRFMIELQNIRGLDEPATFVASPPYAPSRHHESAKLFWSSYCEARGFSAQEARATLDRVCDYLPYYLIIIGWEMEWGNANQGGDPQSMKAGRLANFLASRAHADRLEFLKEWMGIE